MRLPDLRLTTRRLLVLVALVALAVGIESGRRRAPQCSERAEAWRTEAQFFRDQLRIWEQGQVGADHYIKDEWEAQQVRQHLARCEVAIRAYESAGRWFWVRMPDRGDPK